MLSLVHATIALTPGPAPAVASSAFAPRPLASVAPARSRVLRMEEYDPSAFFVEEVPPSWGSAEWKWGSADGAAHTVAERVREELSMQHRRTALLSYARMGNCDFFDLKMALALKCQRARNNGYDDPDGRWEALMEDIAACKFEDPEGTVETTIDESVLKPGDAKLAKAVNQLLPVPVDEAALSGEGGPSIALAAALEHLGFVEKGL